MAERQRSSEEIRQEIERTRADMDETVAAIGQRLTPGQIVDGLWGRVKHTDAPGAVGDVVREHPLPSALIGAGLAWLAYDRMNQTEGERLRRKHGDIGPGTYERAEGRVGPYRGDAIDHTADGAGVGDRLRGAAEGVKHAASSMGERLSTTASGARDRIADTASGVGERMGDARSRGTERLHAARDAADRARVRAGELADWTRDRAGELAGRARGGLERTLDDQPLALGAVAFGLGLASGIAAPATRWEDERLGSRADRIRDEAKRAGREAAESAKRVASETKDAVRDVVEREGVKEELTERVKQVAMQARDAAKQTAQEAAEREGLSGAGLRDRARGVADRARE